MTEGRRRNTRQLEVVWEAVKNETSHPTADQIYAKVRKKIPNISLGTVYRNLQKLVAEEKLQVLTLGRAQHFDPTVQRHEHFICEECGRVYDVFVNAKDRIRPPLAPPKGFSVNSLELTFYGVCKSCSGK
jgi:Fur family peroxide stress response transcriptional regulator